MKLSVIMDKKGRVVGSYRHPNESGDGPVLRLHPGPGQVVHELDMAPEWEKLVSAHDLHLRLAEHVKATEKRPKKPSKKPKKKA